MMTKRQKTYLEERLAKARIDVDYFLSKNPVCKDYTFYEIVRILRKHRVLKSVCENSGLSYTAYSMYKDDSRRERTEMLIDLLDALGYEAEVKLK